MSKKKIWMLKTEEQFALALTMLGDTLELYRDYDPNTGAYHPVFDSDERIDIDDLNHIARLEGMCEPRNQTHVIFKGMHHATLLTEDGSYGAGIGKSEAKARFAALLDNRGLLEQMEQMEEILK